MEAWAEKKIVGLPDVPAGGYPGGLENKEVNVSLRGRTVQIIVKLADIHLVCAVLLLTDKSTEADGVEQTPEKPKYKGGTWHIEGMYNERIVASGIYYYGQE